MFSISYLCFSVSLKIFPLSANWLTCSSVHVMEYGLSLLVHWFSDRGRHCSFLASIPDSWRGDHDLFWLRCSPPVSLGEQGYRVAAGDQLFGGMYVIMSSVHPPYKRYPLRSYRYIVKAIASLDYGHVPSQKIMGRREVRGWLSKGLFYHNHVRKKPCCVYDILI